MDDSNERPSPKGSTESNPKRPRPVLSCLECRRKKLKCDRLHPCQQCQKTSRGALCSYTSGSGVREDDAEDSTRGLHSPKRPRRIISLTSNQPLEQRTDIEFETQGKGLPTPQRQGVIEELQDRVSRLEEILHLRASNGIGLRANSTGRQDSGDEATTGGPMSLNGATASRYHAHHQRMSLLSPFEDARIFMQNLQDHENHPDLGIISRDLLALQAIVKKKDGFHNDTSSATSIYDQMLQLLPNHDICVRMIELYFDNYENCMRIFHKPSFLRDNEMFWASRHLGNVANSQFLPALIGVLSVASSLNIVPECDEVHLNGENLQPTALELIEGWLRTLKPKDGRQLSVLQIRLLMLLPQKCRSARVDEMWNMSGQVARHAMAIGLHRDPSSYPNMSIFEGEQRRRLWMTVVEHELTMSLMCGMPTMVSSHDFTCRPPASVNDVDLFPEMTEFPMSKPLTEWTDTICQSFLAGTLAERLNAYENVSNMKNYISYEDVLKYASPLERVLQELPAPLRFNHASDEASNVEGRLFARMALDTFIRRVLLNLYTPFALAMPPDDRYREARIAYLQSSLVIQCYQDLFDPKFSELDVARQEGYWDLFYKIYRHDIVQTTLGVCLEIKRLSCHPPIPSPLTSSSSAQVSAGQNGGDPVPISSVSGWTRSTLIKAVEDTIEPFLRRVARPGSDPKDLILLVIVFHSVRTNLGPGQKQSLILDSVSEVIASCQRQLQKEGISEPSRAGISNSSSIYNFLPDQWYDLGQLADMTSFDFTMTTFPNIGVGFGDMGFTGAFPSTTWN